MVTPAAGEVVLVPFPFLDLSQSKVRPAVGRGLAWGLLALVILVVNFPVCFVIVHSVEKIKRGERALETLERSTVHLVNASGTRVTKIEVVGATNVP